ncbi:MULTISPECIES: hypothetical protein [unclassified Sphingomonas]|uniref:hypothetical protein n=1 Tax=unclassified Sphingomonas TaxID=196159 RepID=UPI000289281E|nr:MULTISPECIES: hypothetical protein [unclassified Sphingomonas]
MKIIAQDAAQTTQRFRVGMIGLAAVLLLIGLAAAIFSTANHDRQVVAIGSARADVVANLSGDGDASAAAANREPLAELGVAPSAEAENATAIDNAMMPQAAQQQ